MWETEVTTKLSLVETQEEIRQFLRAELYFQQINFQEACVKGDTRYAEAFVKRWIGFGSNVDKMKSKTLK